MRKNIPLTTFAFTVILMAGGCDWVQNRIPADYYDRNNTVPADAGGSAEGQGGAQTTTTPPDGQGGEAATTPPENQGGSPTGGTGGTAPAIGNGEITYEIPAGWYWTDSAHHTAVKGDPAAKPDYYLPEGKIEVWAVKDGTDEEARSAIQSVHAENQQKCANEGAACAGQPYYREIDFVGIKVYAAVSQPGYAGMRTTYARFSKNGKIVSVTIHDDLDKQAPLLEKAVTTIGWQE